jgi:Holliday junction resolvase-like predicted endonuclease
MAKQEINRENTSVGNQFEELVISHLNACGAIHIDSDKMKRSLPKKEIWESTGIEIDIIATFDDRVEYIEAKGGYTSEEKTGKGVGAKRTDNVKKAVSSASLFKLVYPEKKFIAYFSAPPKEGLSSYKMIALSLQHNLFDDVRYINHLKQNHNTLVDEDGRFI